MVKMSEEEWKRTKSQMTDEARAKAEQQENENADSVSIPATGLPGGDPDEANIEMEMEMESDNNAADRKNKGDKKWGKNPNEKKPFFDLSRPELTPAAADAVGSLKTSSGRKKIVHAAASEVNAAHILLGANVSRSPASLPPVTMPYAQKSYSPFVSPFAPAPRKQTRSEKRQQQTNNGVPAWVFGGAPPWLNKKATQKKKGKSHGKSRRQPVPQSRMPNWIMPGKPGWIKF
jgi:hypothetical protein